MSKKIERLIIGGILAIGILLGGLEMNAGQPANVNKVNVTKNLGGSDSKAGVVQNSTAKVLVKANE